MGFFESPSNTAILYRLARIERKLDAIMTRLEIQLPDDGLQQVLDLASAGEKISAIRMYRKLTNVGLAEAKAAVETL
jgi:ribosomal protein L7/L12